jgi:hypothetical protein
MTTGHDQRLAFNRGVIDRRALARLDLSRLALAAEEQTNWVAEKLGPMSLRPGLQYLDAVAGPCKMVPFVFSISDKAKLEFSNSLLRVWVNGVLVTRPAVTTTVANGSFNADLTSWTDLDESGAASAWATGGYMSLTGDGSVSAIREQAITPVQVGVQHALRIVVAQGPVTLRIGSSSLGSQYIRDTLLGVGTHSITITPTGTFYLQFRNRELRVGLVSSVAIEASGTMTLPAPYAEADLPMLRWDQSGDVIYLACSGHPQYKVERRSGGSWSIVRYNNADGPFRVENVGPIEITPSALTGNITLTASDALFDDDHVGALWQVTSAGQKVTAAINSANVFSDPIRITTVGEARRFAIVVSGAFTATVTLQRSIGEIGSWEDVVTYASAVDTTRNDALDNQIVFYRLGVKTGDFTSGPVDVTLNYSAGSITGVVRLTSVASTTSAAGEVLAALGGTDPTSIWAEGQWSTFRGWPSAVAIDDGRLWWAGKDKFNGSITDAFESFDPDFEGDAGPISRSIGFGPVDNINWLLSLGRLIAGTDMMELTCKSTSFDEPLTPTNFRPKKTGTQGTQRTTHAVEIDNKGIFVQRSGIRAYELAFSLEVQDYAEQDLTQLCPEFLSPGVVAVAVQRQPGTRVHFVRSDGTVAMLVFDKTENLICWVGIETAGEVEDVVVLPGTTEDEVYYVVNRSTGRYLERWALETECRGGSINKQADSFRFSSGRSNTITGLDHLEGLEVVAWADGQDLGTFTVVGGAISLGAEYVNRCAGLGYRARFRSSKLGASLLARSGKSSLGASKKVNSIGLVLADTHANGVLYGPDFDTLDSLPLIEEGAPVAEGYVWDAYEQGTFTFPGRWDTDARVCLEANAPRPATVMALIIDMDANP